MGSLHDCCRCCLGRIVLIGFSEIKPDSTSAPSKLLSPLAVEFRPIMFALRCFIIIWYGLETFPISNLQKSYCELTTCVNDMNNDQESNCQENIKVWYLQKQRVPNSAFLKLS